MGFSSVLFLFVGGSPLTWLPFLLHVFSGVVVCLAVSFLCFVAKYASLFIIVIFT